MLLHFFSLICLKSESIKLTGVARRQKRVKVPHPPFFAVLPQTSFSIQVVLHKFNDGRPTTTSTTFYNFLEVWLLAIMKEEVIVAVGMIKGPAQPTTTHESTAKPEKKNTHFLMQHI